MFNGRILCDIIVGRSTTKIKGLLDTGSPVSLLSAGHVRKVLGAEYQIIREYESERKGKLIYPYKSDPIRLMPCYIRNVSINISMYMKEFYFGLTEFKDGSAIIGLDLLSACNWSFNKCTGVLMLDDIDYVLYRTNFLRYFNTDVTELEELCSVFESKNSVSTLLKTAEGD